LRATASLGVGVAALRTNPLRTALSTLGIVVGTAALVAVLALGDGVERYVREQIERTTDLQAIVLTPRTVRTLDAQQIPRTDYPQFTPADADSVRALAGPGALATLMLSGPVLLTGGGGALRAALVTATEPDVVAFQQITVAEGRFFTAAEAAAPAPVTVVSHRLAAEQSLTPGDTVRFGNRAWTVVGVLAPAGPERVLHAFVPLALAADAGMAGVDPPAPVLLVKVERVEAVGAMRQQVETWLARRVGADWRDKVRVGTRADRVAQVQQGMLIFKILMGAITGISLLVGGIGIMNVLLAAVAERTREIGVRKAAGARRRDILWQFLAESVAITGAGSVVGVVVGLAGAYGVTAVMRARTEAIVYAAFTWGTVVVAAGAAITVGVAFGMYPALRAARLSPIDAIRHE